jgi:patatin-related protein
MSDNPAVEYERELRFAVVMYGGVSLAVYMNGAAQELLNMVRATARADSKSKQALYSDEVLSGTSAAIYRDVARLALDGSAEQAAPAQAGRSPIRQRFVIDILSGTSAGGINGVFLAKALANGQSMEKLARMWESDADIGTLINDAGSRRDMPDLPTATDPQSLLNCQRMYAKLLGAFDDMEPATGVQPGTPLVDQLDLFVTATDILGLEVRLQLGGGEVAEERRHRKVFHLTFGESHNDFEKQDNPFLAFISRCTSSFPVAFEPMRLGSAIEASCGRVSPQQRDRWKKHFSEYDKPGETPDASEMRKDQIPFGDGGYLDNKPFGYAIDALGQRTIGDSGQVQRKLIYIEPDPEHFQATSSAMQSDRRVPNAVENALAALQLPRYETIREELLRLRDRNRLVDRVGSVARGVSNDFEALGEAARGALAAVIANRGQFGARKLDEMIKDFGAAYGGYHRLKVGQLTDELSAIAAAETGVPVDSDDFRALRLLLGAWRDKRFAPNPGAGAERASEAGGAAAPKESKMTIAARESEFGLLDDYDLSYRARRLSFVIEQINRFRASTRDELLEALRKHPVAYGGAQAAKIADEAFVDLGVKLDGLRTQLAEVLRVLRYERDHLTGDVNGVVLGPNETAAIRKATKEVMEEPTQRKRRERSDGLVRDGGPGVDAALTKMQQAVRTRVVEARDKARKSCEEILATKSTPPKIAPPAPTTAAELAQHIARHHYEWYELYDSMLFPIVYGSDVGEEIAPVEPVRLSPMIEIDKSGVTLSKGKLKPAGQAVGHFGAFLDERWRAGDILIGRVNAADKLIRTVLAGTPNDRPDVIREWVGKAQRAIVEEECSRRQSVVGKRLSELFNVSTANARFDHLRDEGLDPQELPNDSVVDWIARSVSVLGRVFDSAADEAKGKRLWQPAAKTLSAFLVRSGQILAGVAEVALPRHWWGVVLRRWVPRLLIWAAMLIVLGALFSKDQVVSLGWTVLILTSTLAVLSITLRAWLRGSKGIFGAIRRVLLLASAVGVCLVAVLVDGAVNVPSIRHDLLGLLLQRLRSLSGFLHRLI